MRLGLINSAFAQAGKGTRFGLEQTKALGFDTVDIFTDPLDDDGTEQALIRDTCREERIALLMVTHSMEVASQFERVERLEAINRAVGLAVAAAHAANATHAAKAANVATAANAATVAHPVLDARKHTYPDSSTTASTHQQADDVAMGSRREGRS